MKLVIVACNTAAATGLADLQAHVDVPVLGVIEPGVRSLAPATHRAGSASSARSARSRSGAYQDAVARLAPQLDLTCAACPGFVEFVERGETRSDQVTVLAERLLAPVREAKVDALLLGCTHYPFLARTISDVMGRDVVLVDSADETAFEVRHLLAGTALARDPGGGPARTAGSRAATSPSSSGSAGSSSDPSSTRSTPSPGPESRHAVRGGTRVVEARRPEEGRPLRGCGHDRHPPRRPRRRPAPPHQLRARLHHDGGGLVPRHLRRHAGAVHRVDRRGRAPLDARQGQGLGHRGVLDAPRARRPSGSAARSRTASRPAARRRSSASSAARSGPCATCARWASGR